VQLFTPLTAFIEEAAERLLGNKGFTPVIILSLSLVASVSPAAVYDSLESRRNTGYYTGLTNFLRDLVETRKSGFNP